MKKLILGLSALVSLSGCDAIRDYTNKTLQEANLIEETLQVYTPREYCSDASFQSQVFKIIYDAAEEIDVRFDRNDYNGQLDNVVLDDYNEQTTLATCSAFLEFNNLDEKFQISYTVQETADGSGWLTRINHGFEYVVFTLSNYQVAQDFAVAKNMKFRNLVRTHETLMTSLAFSNYIEDLIENQDFVLIDKFAKDLLADGYFEIYENRDTYVIYHKNLYRADDEDSLTGWSYYGMMYIYSKEPQDAS